MSEDALEALDRMIDEDSRRRRQEMAAKDEEITRLRAENDAAWDSAEHNAKRARDAEARIAELEALIARVHDELHDPTGECWCDCQDADQKLLESLRDHVDRVMDWGGEG